MRACADRRPSMKVMAIGTLKKLSLEQPLGGSGLLTFELMPVGPLAPLGMLIKEHAPN
jgi:hypothetical protein